MSDFLARGPEGLEAVGAALAARLAVRDRGAREVDRHFYDTFDGLLHAAGLAAVHEEGVLSLVELATGAELASAALSRPPEEPLAAGALGPGGLRDRLEPLIGVRALLRICSARCRLHSLDVLDDTAKTVARVSLEQGGAATGADGNRAGPLAPRARVRAVTGYEPASAAVGRLLQRDLGLAPAPRSLPEEAVLAAGGSPDGVSSKVAVALYPEQRADLAASAVLLRLLEVVRSNLAGAASHLDPEFLHDLRVAVRRTRSVQRQFAGVFDPEALAGFRSEFRWLQRATGEARDLDVYVLEFERTRGLVPPGQRGDLELVLSALRGRRERAHAGAARALRSARTANLLTDWERLLEALPSRLEASRPDASRPIAELAGTRIVKVHKRILAMGRAIGPGSEPEAYHELRKRGKELRYLLELFGAALWPEETVKPMVRSLKGLQDVLGRHQDRQVQIDTLRALAGELATRPGGPAAVMAVGVLCDRLAGEERAARAEFAERFAAFSARRRRRQVKDAFG